MAVVSVGSPTVFLNPGRVDARFPLGVWQANVSVVGDLTGGTASASVQMRPSTEPALFLAFSLDHLSASREDLNSLGQHPRLVITQFSPGGVDGSTVDYQHVLEIFTGPSQQQLSEWKLGPMFLGSPVRGQSSEILIEWATNTNTTVYRLRARGQIWLYEGMLDIGGAQQEQSSVPTVSGASSPAGSLQEVRSQRITQPPAVSVGGMALSPGAPGFVGPVARVGYKAPIPTRPTVSSTTTAGRAASLAPAGFYVKRAHALRLSGLSGKILGAPEPGPAPTFEGRKPGKTLLETQQAFQNSLYAHRERQTARYGASYNYSYGGRTYRRVPAVGRAD